MLSQIRDGPAHAGQWNYYLSAHPHIAVATEVWTIMFVSTLDNLVIQSKNIATNLVTILQYASKILK